MLKALSGPLVAIPPSLYDHAFQGKKSKQMTFALSIKQILKILPISYQKPFGTTSKSQGIVLDPSLPLGYISIALPKLSPKPFLELLFPMGLSLSLL